MMRKALLTLLALAAAAAAFANTPAHQMLASYAESFSINLSGTSGAPNTSTSICATDPSGCGVSAGWRFNTDGSMDYRNIGGSYVSWSVSPSEWYDPAGSPHATYYIISSLDAGSVPDSSNMSTCSALTTARTMTWTATAGAFGADASAGTMLVSIYEDSGCSTTLVASGYYRGDAEASP